MADVFAYQPLSDARSIRILTLHPGSKNARLRCDLDEKQLDHHCPIQYEAISYVWGSSTFDRQIVCNGKILPITSSAEAVLLQLRKEDGPRQLWIDSICIDQSSVGEKNHQVGMMGNIYKSAASVIVWLGKSNRRTAKAIEFLLYFVMLDEKQPEHAAMLKKKMEEIRKVSERQNDTSGEDRDYSWSILGEVFGRPWFKRVWTVQEIALSQELEAKVLIGKYELPWGALGLAMSTMIDLEFDHHRLILDALELHTRLQWIMSKRNRPGGYSLDNLGRRFAVEKPSGWFPRIRPIFQMARHKNTTDPRDKIFGLYSILTELGMKVGIPNYNTPCWRVYADATAAMIKHDDNLEVLYDVPSPRRGQHVDGLPSWTPDWSNAWNTGGLYPVVHFNVYKASSGPLHYQFSDDLKSLTLNAIVFDRVASKTKPLPVLEGFDAPEGTSFYGQEGEVVGETSIQVCRTMQKWALFFKYEDFFGTYPTGEGHCFVIGPTLTNDLPKRLENPELIKLSDFPVFSSWFDLMHISDDELEERLIKAKKLPRRHKVSRDKLFVLSMHHHKERMVEYATLVFGSQRGKTLLKTAKGYFGTGDGDVAVGDVVMLVAGLSMPFIMRRCGRGQYRIVGHAYVHGIMDGEAWVDSDATPITIL